MASCQPLLLFLVLFSTFELQLAVDARLGILVPLSNAQGAKHTTWAKSAACGLLAVQHINDRTTEISQDAASFPDDFSLSYFIGDTSGIASTAMAKANDMTTRLRTHIIVGPIESDESGAVALVAGITQTPVISFGATAPGLSDKLTYPFLSRTTISGAAIAEVIVKTCLQLGWKTIATIHQDDLWGSGLAKAVLSAAGLYGLRIVPTQKFAAGNQKSIFDAVQAVQTQGTRIVLVLARDQSLEHVAFAAEELGIIDRGWGWLTASGISDPKAVIAASSDPPRLARLVSGFIAFVDAPLNEDHSEKIQTAFAQAPLEYIYDPVMGDITKQQLDDAEATALCGYHYDAVLGAALAISKAAALDEGGQIPSGQTLLGQVRTTNFVGATGPVVLDPRTGDRDYNGVAIVMKNWLPGTAADGSPTVDPTSVAVYLENELSFLRTPYWIGGQQTWEQRPPDGYQCEPGQAVSDTTLKCEPCPAGTQQNGQFCEPCPLGTHAQAAGTPTCARCGKGFANVSGLAECHLCPSLTYRPAGSLGVSVTECVCETGSYAKLGPGERCEPCPSGAVCNGGHETPYPKAGFWGDKGCVQLGGDVDCPDWDMFIECNPASNCRGGRDFECADGRTGRMCLSTAEGWFNVGRLNYLECSAGGMTSLAGILLVVLCWVLMLWATGAVPALDSLFQFMVINAMITTYGLKWHRDLNTMNIFLKISNFDLDFVSPECFGEWSAMHSFFAQIFLPFIVGIVVGPLLYVLSAIDWRSKCPSFLFSSESKASIQTAPVSLYQCIVRLIITLAFTTYHTGLYKSFSAFSCVSFPDGSQYLLLFPELECWKGGHIAMVVGAVVYILGVGLALPIGCSLLIRRHRENGSLVDPSVKYMFGWMHERYQMKWKHWNTMVCCRRFFIALIAAVIPFSLMQGLLSVVVLAALLAAQVLVRPHTSFRVDLLECIALTESILFVLSGMLMYPSLTPESQGRICSGLGDDAFCRLDEELKQGLAGWTLFTLSLTLVLAGLLSMTISWEERKSDLACKAMVRVHSPTEPDGPNSEADSALEDSKSQFGLIFAAMPVLQWAATLKNAANVNTSRSPSQGSIHRRLSSSSTTQLLKSPVAPKGFSDVAHTLADLHLHFHSAKSIRGQILQELISAPGLLEFISEHDDGREALLTFINSFAEFVLREKSGHRERRLQSRGETSASDLMSDGPSDDSVTLGRINRRNSLLDLPFQLVGRSAPSSAPKTPFPLSELIKREHLPVTAYYLLTCAEEERADFSGLVDALLAANNQQRPRQPVDPLNREWLAQRTPRSKSDAPTHQSRLRRLSLDDWVSQAGTGSNNGKLPLGPSDASLSPLSPGTSSPLSRHATLLEPARIERAGGSTGSGGTLASSTNQCHGKGSAAATLGGSQAQAGSLVLAPSVPVDEVTTGHHDAWERFSRGEMGRGVVEEEDGATGLC